MARHLGASQTISQQPLKLPLSFVCVLQTDTSLSYLVVDSTRTAVGLFPLLIRRPGTRYPMNSEILPFRRIVLTVLNSAVYSAAVV